MIDGGTIAAIATPPGAGGIGIVRISGPDAARVLGALVGREPSRFEERRLSLATVREPGGGDAIDRALVVLMRAPRSYTGEDVAEVQAHGGPGVLGRILQAALAAGARAAEPGELTRRAFANGRLDLAQAEAVALLVGAQTARAARLAEAQAAGALGQAAEAARARVVELRAEVEAAVDFPEDGLELAGGARLAAAARAEAAGLTALAATFGLGRAIERGLTVALVGAPNVGKSSLLNALCGEARALVAAEPGTTRDWLEARTAWEGIAVTLIDTAGVRETLGEVEAHGIRAGRAAASRADVVVEVRDASAPGARVDPAAAVVAWNKCDLAAADGLAVSARTGEGLDTLRAAVLAAAGASGVDDAAGGGIVTTERQRVAIAAAAAAMATAAGLLDARAPAELTAEELRAAERSLHRVVGGDATEDVLDAVFRRFCLGK